MFTYTRALCMTNVDSSDHCFFIFISPEALFSAKVTAFFFVLCLRSCALMTITINAKLHNSNPVIMKVIICKHYCYHIGAGNIAVLMHAIEVVWI